LHTQLFLLTKPASFDPVESDEDDGADADAASDDDADFSDPEPSPRARAQQQQQHPQRPPPPPPATYYASAPAHSHGHSHHSSSGGSSSHYSSSSSSHSHHAHQRPQHAQHHSARRAPYDPVAHAYAPPPPPPLPPIQTYRAAHAQYGARLADAASGPAPILSSSANPNASATAGAVGKAPRAREPKRAAAPTGGRFRCTYAGCDKSFTREGDRQRHLSTTLHKGEAITPDRRAEIMAETRDSHRQYCIHCGRILLRVESRRRHEETPGACDR
jgi:hypothetical protein